MSHNNIKDILHQLSRIKNGGNIDVVKIGQIEALETELSTLETFFEWFEVDLPDSLSEITKKTQLIEQMLHSIFGGTSDECTANINVETLVSQLSEFVEGYTSLLYKNELNGLESEYLDYLDKNLNDAPRYLVRSGLLSVDEIKFHKYRKHVKFIQKKLNFFRYVYDREINGCIDHEKLNSLKARIEFMADNVWQFSLVYRENGNGDDTANIDTKPPYLLCLVVLVELEMKKILLGEQKDSKFTQLRAFRKKKLPEGFSRQLYSLLVYLKDRMLKKFASNVSARNIDEVLAFLLVFLTDVPNRFINGNELNEVLEKVGVFACDIIFLCQKFLTSSTIKDDTSKINIGIIQIQEKSEDLKSLVEERYYKLLKFVPSQFPAVGGLSFLDSLVRRLNEMLNGKSGLELLLKPHIVILKKELSYLMSTFREVANMHHEYENFKALKKHTISMAYEAEVAFDAILAQYNGLWHLFCSLPAVIKELRHVSAEVAKLRLNSSSLEETCKPPTTQISNPMNIEDIVGLEDEKEGIFEHLIQRKDELDVLPIVGMAGIGKTTFARKLYTDHTTTVHFDYRAWCCITQTYNRRELLQEILSQVTNSKDKVDEVDTVLADMLRKRLLGKRYLIVLDDVWNVTAWDDLRFSFPDGENGSRIIVTTRLEKVAEQVKQQTDPYFLPFLTTEKSWELLRKRVFQNEDCPPELYDVGLAIAERCKGLPLVVVLVAGIIRKEKMEKSWWEEVRKDLFSYLGKFDESSLATVHLSYDYLPDYLRPCFLYIGIFPEDAKIRVSELISLWIAEGFVQNNGSQIMEEAAEGYLMDLLSSNMVMVSRRRYNGKVKSCHIHDVVLHFCLEKSREEKFMMAVRGYDYPFQPSNWKMVSRANFNFSNELSKSTGSRNRFPQRLRSLTMTSRSGILSWLPSCQVISKLRLLKVLDLKSYGLRYMSLATLNPLIHLKYLAVRLVKFFFDPKSLLLHLETLIVQDVLNNDNPVVLPTIFWKMKKLRHVDIGYITKFYLQRSEQWIFQESSKLENLRVLRHVKLDTDYVDPSYVLQRCPNLQELEVCYEILGSSTIYPKLKTLTQLQVLRLSFLGMNMNLSKSHLPSNLKKLALRGPDVVTTAPKIATLPSLEYLELMDNFKKSKEWCLGDISFDKLKFLKLVEVGISCWDASETSFPVLETLVITRCHKLEEIPLSFADIQTLKQVKVISCDNESLEDSAFKIREEIEENEGSDRIDIIVKH